MYHDEHCETENTSHGMTDCQCEQRLQYLLVTVADFMKPLMTVKEIYDQGFKDGLSRAGLTEKSDATYALWLLKHGKETDPIYKKHFNND